MKKRTGNGHNLHLYLLLKFAWAFISLMIVQLAFAICNRILFDVQGMHEWLGIAWGNIRFGFATVAIVLSPYWLMMLLPFKARTHVVYRGVSSFVYWLLLIVMLTPGLCDVAYYPFTYRRLSADIFSYLTVGGKMGTLGPKFLLDYWYVVLVAVALLLVHVFFARGNRLDKTAGKFEGWGTFFVGMAVVVVLAMGGWNRSLVLERGEAARCCQIANTPLVTNSAYNIIYTARHPRLDVVEFDTPIRQAELFYPVTVPSKNIMASHPDPRWGAGGGCLTGDDGSVRYTNVVVLILESFSQEYMGCYNKGKEESFTPFLDSLARYSHLYNGRSNGKKSIESIPAIMSSVPTLMEAPVSMSPYGGNAYSSLPKVLKKYGYTSAFFHNSYNGVMGFDRMCRKMGFDLYFGQNEYQKRYGDEQGYDGVWGIFDEPWLHYMVEEVNKLPEPFFVGEFTISSHHPYTVPDEYKGKLKKGKKPLLQVVNYTDNALRSFFAEASRQPWFNHTVFVIMGDHPGCVVDKDYAGLAGAYRIPMMVYLPGEQSRGTSSATIMQQTDVMPTLIDFLGLRESTVAFGSSLFQSHGGWQVVFGSGYYILNRGTRTAAMMYRPDGGKKNGIVFEGEPDDVDFLQAVVQQYNERMEQNRMVVKK